MPGSRFLIASNTLTTSAASVTFSSIPDIYTDLALRYSVRGNITGTDSLQTGIQFNGTTSGYSHTYLYGNGTTTASGSATSQSSLEAVQEDSTGNTANIFASCEIYIPNYTSSTNKPVGRFGASEQNGTTAYISVHAGLSNVTSAITSITIKTNANDFIAGSSFFLYGIKNS